jgi:hypothetical protein
MTNIQLEVDLPMAQFLIDVLDEKLANGINDLVKLEQAYTMVEMLVCAASEIGVTLPERKD